MSELEHEGEFRENLLAPLLAQRRRNNLEEFGAPLGPMLRYHERLASYRLPRALLRRCAKRSFWTTVTKGRKRIIDLVRLCPTRAVENAAPAHYPQVF